MESEHSQSGVRNHPINEAFFHPLVSLPIVRAHQKEQLAQNTLRQLEDSLGHFIHDSPSSGSIYSCKQRGD